MHTEFLAEPELEFGMGRHIDIRLGISMYGAFDFGSELAPKEIRLAVVGTAESADGLQSWLRKCRSGIDAKESRQPNLFPQFPGFHENVGFRCSLSMPSQLQRTIGEKEIQALSALSHDDAVRAAADLYISELQYLAQGNVGFDVMACSLPPTLLEILEPETSSSHRDSGGINFRSLLKARAMAFGKPIQLVRPRTYGAAARRRKGSAQSRPVQDEATRAWNIHAALYYKAQGLPWRLARPAAEYATCYVGIAFYRSLDQARVETSMAQVFDDRGSGMIVRGGTAKWSRDDRQVHMDEKGAHDLLANALSAYRQEHRHAPARVVVHKTSAYNDAELSGFSRSLDEAQIELFDLVSLSSSLTRLFRHGAYPPLRGTFLHLDESKGVLYTKGSVSFYQTYPGQYVPMPVLIRRDRSEQPLRVLANDVLSLTKMNWNNTQFDGGVPITISAARYAGDVLKYLPEESTLASQYRFYM
ncbi:MAG: hypothetical protein U0531_22635 [Dehalococcoidia bacterium]